jgi:hypothetical protein
MKLKQLIGAISVGTGLSLSLAGAALASDVTIGPTGAGSTQQVTINNSSNVTSTNTNVVSVTNQNVQQATTGSASANNNTTVGNVASGNAANTATTTTTVSIGSTSAGGTGDNGGTPTPSGGSGGSENGGNSGGSGPTGGSSAGGQSGSVLGAATTAAGLGVATLPVTGPVDSVDVSALRAAWHPQIEAPTVKLVQGSRTFDTVMLLVASFLSLMGAIGSAIYAQRKEGRVRL